MLQGIKSSKEKFAGALFTTTVEAFVPANGKAIQVSCLKAGFLAFTPCTCWLPCTPAEKALVQANSKAAWVSCLTADFLMLTDDLTDDSHMVTQC